MREIRGITLVLLTLVALVAIPTAAAAQSFSVKSIDVDVNVGPSHALSCTIDANLYRPSNATSRHPDPSVLMTNPFLGSKADDDGLAENFAAAGYVVLSYSGLGWGQSSCPIELDSPSYDGEAASQLVTFLGGGSATTDGQRIDYVKHDSVAANGRHYAHDPRVGMIGVSYGAETEFAAADKDPRIDTIIPIATWNDLSYSLAPNDAGLTGNSVSSAIPGTEKTEWDTELLAGGGIGGTVGGVTGGSGLTGCSHFNPGVCPMAVDLETNGFLDPAETSFLRHDSVASYVDHIAIPTMLVQGEDDTLFTLKEAVATYTSLRKRHVPVRLVWQSWGHSDTTPAPGELGENSSGDLDLKNPDGSLTVEGRLIMDWMNHYLKGQSPAPALNFSFFKPWVHYSGDDAGAAYSSAPSYPIGRSQSLYLSNTDKLVGSAADVTTGHTSFVTPLTPASVTEISGISQSVPLSDLPGTYAEWESAPLSRSTYVVGSPKLRLNVSAAAPASGGDLTVFARLEDIAPDGSVTLPDRLIAPARFPFTNRQVTIDLPAIAHRFPAGDRIALVLAGSDSAYEGDPSPTTVTIPTSASAPGSLTLPVVGDGSLSRLVYTQPANTGKGQLHSAGPIPGRVPWAGGDWRGRPTGRPRRAHASKPPMTSPAR